MPAGRPTEYKREYVQRAAEMCANGATDIELADELDVSVSTLYNWRAKYPEFLQAVKTAKEIADERVERSLFQRAVGFEHEAVKVGFTKEGVPLYAPYREVIPPDTNAASFWLKNRQPDKWRDKTEMKLTGDPLAELLSEFRREHESAPKPDAPDAGT
jgi:orotate phosphoribosyltransferase-like protein